MCSKSPVFSIWANLKLKLMIYFLVVNEILWKQVRICRFKWYSSVENLIPLLEQMLLKQMLLKQMLLGQMLLEQMLVQQMSIEQMKSKKYILPLLNLEI